MGKVFGKKNGKLAADNYILLMQQSDASLLLNAIIAAMNCGGNITFGRTKDGKSVSVAFYDGEEQEKEYAADVQELNELLESIIDYGIDTGKVDAPPPPPPTNNTAARKRK